MAYDTLKTEIRQYIKTNGANEITGQILQNVLLDMVNAYPSLDGYATQQWVQNQISDMATMTWVGQQGFITNSALANYLPLSGGVMTGSIIAGELSTGSYSLEHDGLSFSYSYNGSPRYARKILISSVNQTITFYGREMTVGTVIETNQITSDKFIVTNGTSSQFLKADGSVDSNTYLTSAAISDMATQTWVGNNYLPLTGGTITSNLSVNGEFDTFSRMQVNGTSNAHPFLRLHIPNVNWTRLQMDTLGVIHVLDGANGTSYNGFACGNATANSITLGRSTSGYDSIRFREDEFVKIYREGSDDSLVLCADSTAGGGIVLRSSETNPVSIITDIQGGTSNTMNWYIYNTGDAQFNSVSQTSDIRRKNIISDIGMAIGDIAQAPMFRFTMKDDDEAIVRVGTSAQYWQTLLPEVVSENKKGVLGMQYDVAAMAGVITVAKHVVDHEARIAELEKENALLKAKLNIN
jgi:hypothetical protein